MPMSEAMHKVQLDSIKAGLTKAKGELKIQLPFWAFASPLGLHWQHPPTARYHSSCNLSKESRREGQQIHG